jgi:hypothetical protein
MSEFYYIIDDGKGTRLYLSNEGPQKESAERGERVREEGFRHVEDRRIGACVVHIFERATPATDIVGRRS